MGFRRLDSLGDLSRHGFYVQLRCLHCGRRAVYSPHALIQFGLAPALPLKELGRRAKCEGGPDAKGCGRRGAKVTGLEREDVIDTPTFLPPAPPVRYPAPRGVNPEEWAKADWRGRKRLIRQARG